MYYGGRTVATDNTNHFLFTVSIFIWNSLRGEKVRLNTFVSDHLPYENAYTTGYHDHVLSGKYSRSVIVLNRACTW